MSFVHCYNNPMSSASRSTITMLVITVVILLGIIGFFVFSPSSVNDDAVVPTADEAELDTADPNTESGNTSSEPDKDTAPPEPTEEELCIEEINRKQDEGEYTSGSLLVSFEAGVSYDTAVEHILTVGLSLSEGDQQEQYTERGWLDVAVPEGEEARWYCRIESWSAVRTVSLNSVFKLHE